MENLSNNCFEVKIPLHESECLHSKKLEKICSLKFTKEDDNIFKIDAVVDDKEFIASFTIFDLLNMKQKNFIHKIHNFKLLLKAIKKGVKKNKVTVSQLNTSLKLTLFYTIVYDKEKISFELNPKPSEEDKKEEEKEKVNEIKNENYKAELIEYSRDMEDLGDRNIVKAIFENKGSFTWPKGKTSFTCLPEFSSLFCQECILEDDVMPGEQIEINLEFLKNGKQGLKKKYFTALNLNVYQDRFENIFLLNFNNPLNQEKVDENVDDNEKEGESEEITESSEEIEENKVNNLALKKEDNKINKEEVKIEEKEKEKVKEKEKKDEKETIKEDVNEKVEIKENKKEKEKVEIKENAKGKVDEKEKKEDLKNDETGKMSDFKKKIFELNKKEKERKEIEEEQKKEKGWRKLFHFHHKKK